MNDEHDHRNLTLCLNPLTFLFPRSGRSRPHIRIEPGYVSTGCQRRDRPRRRFLHHRRRRRAIHRCPLLVVGQRPHRADHQYLAGCQGGAHQGHHGEDRLCQGLAGGRPLDPELVRCRQGTSEGFQTFRLVRRLSGADVRGIHDTCDKRRRSPSSSTRTLLSSRRTPSSPSSSRSSTLGSDTSSNSESLSSSTSSRPSRPVSRPSSPSPLSRSSSWRRLWLTSRVSKGDADSPL